MSDSNNVSTDEITQLKYDVSGIRQELAAIRQLMVQYMSRTNNDLSHDSIVPVQVEPSNTFQTQNGPKITKKQEILYCSNCSNPIKSDQRFCTNCGQQYDMEASHVPEMETLPKDDLSYLKNSIVTKHDITDGLKFNYRSIIKISQSSTFTVLGLQLFVIAGLLNAGSTAINLLLFGELTGYNEVIQLFAVLFYSYVFIILALSFFIEFSLKNMKLDGVSFAGSMRVTGFLSTVLIARGTLSIIYNLYIYLLGSGELGLSYFALFEAISWFITVILLTIYLVIYLSNRAGLSSGFAFLILVVMTGFTVSIYYLYFLNLFYMLSTYNVLALGFSVLAFAASVFLQIRKK